MRWFRMYSDAIDHEKLKLLSFEDRWHFVAVCCLKSQGALDERNGNLLERKVAVKLGLSAPEASEVKRRLIEVDLIGKDWQPKNWDTRQYVSDSSTERVRKFRQKRSGNVSVTPPDTDTDTEHNPTGYSSAESADACPHQAIIALYHEVCTALPKVRSWTTGRSANLRQRWREAKRRQSLDWWRNFFEVVAASDFLCGRVQNGQRKPFVADLGWLVKPENFAKILEGKYDNG